MNDSDVEQRIVRAMFEAGVKRRQRKHIMFLLLFALVVVLLTAIISPVIIYAVTGNIEWSVVVALTVIGLGVWLG